MFVSFFFFLINRSKSLTSRSTGKNNNESEPTTSTQQNISTRSGDFEYQIESFNRTVRFNNGNIYQNVVDSLDKLLTLPPKIINKLQFIQMYQRHIIYVNAFELDFIDTSIINQELYDIPTIFTVSEFLPDFLNKLEEKRFGSWKELATWARSSFGEFANRVWPTKSQDEVILVNYIQDIMIHYGEYFDEPYQKNLLEGDVNCCHIIPLTKILRKYCLIVSGERFSRAVQFRNKFSKSSNGRGSKTDMGGDIAGYEIFTIENSFDKNEWTKKYIKDELKLAIYNRDDLFAIWHDVYKNTLRSFYKIEEKLKLLRTWSIQLSGQHGGHSGLHIDLYSTRQPIAGLFLFLSVDSVPLPRQEEEPGFRTLSKVIELMIRLAHGIHNTKKRYEMIQDEIRTLKRGQFPCVEKRSYMDESKLKSPPRKKRPR
ncbi:hypothetical protein RCL_jg17699.t1 [Rhizophagus clarus]|uniref:Uncharacterized protein n=1 Tax=Rhizophagus clarus TaxID=94130 RepID=A0A8H3QLE7_9GLOM|nr:hypothetical protein RCL_jg17699.t1 [Rhizophagus clarus]